MLTRQTELEKAAEIKLYVDPTYSEERVRVRLEVCIIFTNDKPNTRRNFLLSFILGR